MFGLFEKKKATLIIEEKNLGTYHFDLKSKNVLIGRSKSAFSKAHVIQGKDKIEFAHNEFTKRISPEQGSLIWNNSEKKYVFKDHSQHGTLVDGDPLEHGEERTLEHNAQIIIHPFKLRVEYP